MDLSLERDSTALGSLFQQIIADMKNTSPLWEDFVAKASKLHACLRAAIQAIAAYLDAFQKIADAATNSRGASKEIGTALTRVCLRHKAVETRMKTFTSAIMDCLIIPLQEKLEDWKRQVATLDKEHAKEHKRCRTELKKRSSDTLRLQKKARKGQSDTIQSLVDSHMHDVTMRRAELEEVERKSLRAAMVEERMRYCSFVYMLQPVVKEECEVMSELGHLQEAMQSIAIVTKEPNVLPQSSEELILESKSTINLYPESPGGNSGSQGCSNSLGSRKSSVCSISSMNSSGSSGSPGHHHYQRSLSQLIPPAIRLKPGESSDSGFCSSPALTSQTSTSTSQSHAVSTWPPHSQDVVQATDRPHTISSAYEKGHQRPALTVYTFQNPETIMESQKSPATIVCRPPLPVRCSSLERPLSSTGIRNNNVNLIQRQCPSPIPAHITKELPQHQPTYVNMSELASMAAMKITNQQLQQQHQQIMQQQQQQQQQQYHQSKPQQPLQSNSPNSNQSLSQAPSESPATLNSHQQQISSSDLLLSGNAVSNPSPMTAGTTPSSGDSPPSTSQNNSPQLTSSPQTPLTGSGCVIAGNNYSTKDSVAVENELKITETDTSISNANNQTTTTTNNTPPNNQNSPAENDDIPRGSVLEKMSLFEKLEQQQLVNNNPPPLSSGRSSHSISSGDSIYGSRKEEIYKTSSGVNDKDPVDQIYEDSIQELNNLIGELDSFQREHEMKEQENRLELQQGGFIKDPLNPQSISCVDTDSDKISIGSLNYSTQSTNASDVKFAYSDSEISRYVSESSSVGFENPTFAHFNNTDEVDNKSNDDDSGSGQITIYDHNFVIAPDIDYMRQNSEIVVLRCKDVTTTTTTATADATDGNEPKQRLSSFRSDQLQQTLQRQQQQQQQQQHQQQQQQNSPQPEKRSSTTSLVSSDKGTASIDDYKLTKTNLKRVENYLVNDPSTNKTSMKEFKANLDERLRSKPIISPRPASLSGCVTRIARRSSVNTTKPPPPIRRSSSVTPSHNLTTPNSPNLIQQNLMNTSAESLPPPPAYLLDRTNNASPTINVAETVKALTVIRHTPASPSALRRAQNQQINQTPTIQTNKQHNNTTSLFSPTMNDGSIGSMYTPPSSNSNTTNTLNSDNHNSSFRTTNSNSPGIYAQPKQVTKMSSFRSPSPAGPQKTSTSLIAQLNARLTPSKQSNQHTQQVPQHNDYTSYHHAYQDNRNQTQTAQSTHSSGQNSPHHQNYIQSEQIYSRAGERYYHGTQHQHQHQHQQSQHYDGKNNQIYTSSTQYQHHHYHIQNDSHHNQSQSGAITNSQAQYHHHNHHHQHHHPTHCHQPVEQQNQQPISHQHNQHHRSHVHAQHQLQQQQQHQSSRHNIHQKILVSTNPFITTTTVHYSSSSFGNSTPGQYAANTNYTPSNNEKSGSIRAKTKAEFLENLNAKLAKQGLSGRAFAVRNLINSKALHFENLSRLHRQEKAIKPDPRLCHESLMDQIKRGATLKRNRTINDRSAPKIH